MGPVNLFSDDLFLERLLQWLPHERLNTMALLSKRMVIFTDREKIQRINSKPYSGYSSLYDFGYRKMEVVGNLLLRNPNQLKSLNLWKFTITRLDLASILASSPSLVKLGLSNTSIDDEDCVAIARDLKNLTDLHLYECKQITDEGVLALSKGLPQLGTLGLSNCDQITDKSLFSIVTGMQSLKVLSIQCCHKITTVGVRRLCTDLPNLLWIDIRNSVRITRDDYFRLREDFPNISIIH